MNGADSRTGKSCDSGFRHHGHIQANAVAFFDASGFQYIGKFADFRVEFFVCECSYSRSVIAFPDQSGLISAGFKMSVQAIVGCIQLAAFKPANVSFVEIVFAQLFPFLEPMQKRVSLFRPKFIGGSDTSLVEFAVFLTVYKGAFGDIARNFVNS